MPILDRRVVYVEWVDSYVASEGWTSIEESEEQTAWEPIRAVGFLVADSPDGIVLASGWNQHADEVSGALSIPRSAIRKMSAWMPPE